MNCSVPIIIIIIIIGHHHRQRRHFLLFVSPIPFRTSDTAHIYIDVSRRNESKFPRFRFFFFSSSLLKFNTHTHTSFGWDHLSAHCVNWPRTVCAILPCAWKRRPRVMTVAAIAMAISIIISVVINSYFYCIWRLEWLRRRKCQFAFIVNTNSWNE